MARIESDRNSRTFLLSLAQLLPTQCTDLWNLKLLETGYLATLACQPFAHWVQDDPNPPEYSRGKSGAGLVILIRCPWGFVLLHGPAGFQSRFEVGRRDFKNFCPSGVSSTLIRCNGPWVRSSAHFGVRLPSGIHQPRRSQNCPLKGMDQPLRPDQATIRWLPGKGTITVY